MFEEYIPALNEAGYGERWRVIAQIMKTWGCGKDKVYRELKKAGWDSGRPRRTDAGSTTVSEDALQLLAAKLRTGIRKDGRHTAEIPTARWLLETQNGIDFGGVSNSRLATLLRERGLDIRTQKAPRPHVNMQSLHPNHVHQVDPSLCLVYYLPSGGQEIIEADEVYKNKPYLKGKEDLKVWRYVLTDHYSSSLCVRYYNEAGENSHTLWDFLLYAWSPKADPAYLFHGVPRLLYWDKGSANKAGAIKNALGALEVEELSHMPGVPRAKGQVEKANHLVETHFEAHLKEDPAASVQELNQWVEAWCAAYNANTLKGYDSTLKRAGKSRQALWRSIRHEDLRELPEVARDLLVSSPITRKVSGDLTISYVHPRLKESHLYRVGGLTGVRVGMSVEVSPLLMDPTGSIKVLWSYQGSELSQHLQPAEIDGLSGFPAASPVFGQSYKSPGETWPQKAVASLVPVVGNAKKPFSHLNNGQGLKGVGELHLEGGSVVPLPRTGQTIDPQQSEESTISVIQAARRLGKILGYWEGGYLRILRERYPQGVPQGRLGEIAGMLREATDDDTQKRIG